MSRAQRFKLIAVLLTLAAVALAAVVFLVSFSLGVAMPMNGAWLVAVLAGLAGVGFAVAAAVEEYRERNA